MSHPTPSIAIKVLDHANDLPLPEYATSSSAGMDLLAAIVDDVMLPAGGRVLISTGIAIALEPGLEAQIRPRSGLALKNGITVLNSPGTIDADYRGEIKVILANISNEHFTVTRGMRIAQMVIARYVPITWKHVANLDETSRGEGGFGSTGVQTKVSQPA